MKRFVIAVARIVRFSSSDSVHPSRVWRHGLVQLAETILGWIKRHRDTEELRVQSLTSEKDRGAECHTE